MDMMYSKTTGGFYHPSINKDIPADAVQVVSKDYNDLILGQSKGKIIRPNNEGYPILVDPPPPTPEEEQEAKNQEARDYLNKTDWYVVRFAETGVPIPADITAAREEARKSIVVV